MAFLSFKERMFIPTYDNPEHGTTGHVVIDHDKCNGCGICAQRCQYGALKFEVTTEVANIDQFACYGCGLCQTGCPRGAINLISRAKMPALAEVWR